MTNLRKLQHLVLPHENDLRGQKCDIDEAQEWLPTISIQNAALSLHMAYSFCRWASIGGRKEKVRAGRSLLTHLHVVPVKKLISMCHILAHQALMASKKPQMPPFVWFSDEPI